MLGKLTLISRVVKECELPVWSYQMKCWLLRLKYLNDMYDTIFFTQAIEDITSYKEYIHKLVTLMYREKCFNAFFVFLEK